MKQRPVRFSRYLSLRLFAARTAAVEQQMRASFAPLTTLLRVAPPAHFGPKPYDGLDRFIARARTVIETVPIVTSMVAGNEAGVGWLYLAVPELPPLVRLTDRTEWGDRHRFLFLDEQGKTVREEMRYLPYDPRDRAWYRLAQEHPGQVVWTEPYRFFTTKETGVTASIGWRDDRAGFAAMGFDVRLVEWQQVARDAAAQLAGRVVISDGAGRVIADSQGIAMASEAGENDVLPQLPLAQSPWSELLRHFGKATLFFDTGTWWVGTVHALTVPGLAWQVWLFTPLTHVIPDWYLWAGGWLLVVAFSFLLARVLSVRWAKRLAKPLQTLAAAAEAIGKQQFDTAVPRQQAVWELYLLAQALDGLRRRLRVAVGRLEKQREVLHQQIAALNALEERLSYVGLHDPVTDLPNRRLFVESLKQAVLRAARQRTRLAVLFIDFDHFKTLNDTHGHEAGDRFLIEMAARLKTSLRRSDLAARLGGDEFAVLLDGVGEEEAIRVAQTLLSHLSEPVALGAVSWHASASIGVACFPEHGSDPQALLRAADLAMYWAKETGRGRVVCYAPEKDEAFHAQEWIRSALNGAEARGELSLWWQPQIALATGAVAGAEVLLRWHHPEKGLVSPAQFIPVAEASGLMIPIGHWVLERFDVPPSALELELTESMMADMPVARTRLAELEALGVRLAIDDFGTGYSSLAYLSALPFDLLKIDAMFVQAIGSSSAADALVESFVRIAKALQMDTVAEGVERAEQADFLRRNGVAFAQGYFFARPMPFSAFRDWMLRRTSSVNRS
ncbi:MAG: EAL domain-containing protein [Hydrogenophilus sp.]